MTLPGFPPALDQLRFSVEWRYCGVHPMRLALWFTMLAFALGAAPALAQDASTPAYPDPPAPATKPAARHAVKPTAGKPGMVKAAKESQKPASAKPDAGNPQSKRDVFAGVPGDERPAIQSALLWSGDYTGSIGSEDPMLTAIKNFQKRSKAKVTGELTPDERTRLIVAAHDHEQEFGWSVVADPTTGVHIGLPTKLVPQARDAVRGTRWSSAHGEIQVETFRVKTGDLPALFDKEKKEPATRKVENSALQPDGFSINGMQGLKIFSVKVQMRDGEVRGFTVLYDQAVEGIVAPVLVAMTNAFTPFPERSAPFAALAKSVEYGTGLIVSSLGDIVTDRKLTQGCQVIVAKGLGDADRLADDPESGLALLRVYGTGKLAPLSLALDAPKPGELTLIGMPDPKDQDGRKTLTEIKARLADGGAIELPEPVPMAGFSGAAALDASGKFLGMTEMGNAVLASVAPALPPVRLVPAQTIRAFLEAHDIAPAQAQGGDARASAVRIICVRK
jgi:hypothetical protein